MTPLPPHAGQPVLTAGTPIERAQGAMIMVHGRGASPNSILELVPHIERPGFAFLAPAAANGTWYPHRFLAEIAMNEPGISSGLSVLDHLVRDLESRGMPRSRTMLLGFSQGACLASEFAARNAARYGGVIVLSGGVIGPPGTPRNYPGTFEGTPIFLGCSDVDPHIPKDRVEESAAVFERLGAAVTARLYPGMGHDINEDEIESTRRIMDTVLSGAAAAPR
jgi:predicted esterase